MAFQLFTTCVGGSASWQPPLNLKDVVTPWTTKLKAARKAMADQARANAAG